MKTKIPPPVIMLFAGALMWFVAHSAIGARWVFPYQWLLAALFVGIGIAMAATAIFQFRSASTTVNPHKLENASVLVRSGIFAHSRNPMYTGLLCVLVAWAIWLGSLANIVLLALFVVAITVLQIKPEEAMLKKLFGSEFENYLETVRRWI